MKKSPERFSEMFSTLREQIKFILECQPKTRSNDYALFVETITMFYDAQLNMDILELELFGNDRFPSFESITRARRYVQSIFPNLASEKTLEKRKAREEEIHEYFSQEKE